MKKQKALSLAINAVMAGALMVGASGAMAYQAGDFIVRAGAANVDPNDDSNAIKHSGLGAVAGSEAKVEDDTQLGLTFTYMLTDHVGLGLLASTPFDHDIKADLGGLGSYDAGSTKHLPPTLTVQYFPLEPSSKFQPYAGVGVNYTFFFDENVDGDLEGALGETGGDLSLEDSLGLAFELGMDYQLNEHWVLNASVWYINIDTKAKFHFDSGTRVETDVSIDPWVYMVGIGYKF